MIIEDITEADAIALADRIDLALANGEGISRDDLALLRRIFDTWFNIVGGVREGSMSMRRLKEIFGVALGADKKDPPENVKKDDSSPATGSGGVSGGDGEPKAPRNHNHPGRRGHEDFAGAPKHTHCSLDQHLGNGCQEPDCNGKLYHFRRDGKFRTLVRISGQAPLRAERHEFKDLRCNQCNKVYAVPAPESLLKDGPIDQMYGYSAIATVATYKYMGGTPWYRQSKLCHDLGIDISPSTQWDLCERLADSLLAIYRYFKILAADGRLFYGDDTTYLVLNERSAIKTRRGTKIETLRTGSHTSGVISELPDGRHIVLLKTGILHAGEWLDEIMQHRSSGLAPPLHMADRSSSNPVTVRETIELACNAHARIKFASIEKNFKRACGWVLSIYEKVYKKDAHTKKMGMNPAERQKYLKAEALPLMESLFAKAVGELSGRLVEPNSGLGEAYQYLLNHREELLGFITHLGAPIDNLLCERQMKQIVMMRKNSWFYLNGNGAAVSDVIKSVGETVVMAAGNPYEYFTTIQRHADEVRERPEDYLPWNYKETLGIQP